MFGVLCPVSFFCFLSNKTQVASVYLLDDSLSFSLRRLLAVVFKYRVPLDSPDTLPAIYHCNRAYCFISIGISISFSSGTDIYIFLLQIHRRKPPFIVVPPLRCVTPERITSGCEHFTETHTEQLQIGQGNFSIETLKGFTFTLCSCRKFSTNVSIFGTHSYLSGFFSSLTVCQELCSSFEDPRADTVLDHLLACWNSNQQQRPVIGLVCRRERVWSGTL